MINDKILATMKGIEFIKNAEVPRNIQAINSNKIKVKLILEGSIIWSRMSGNNLIIRKNVPISHIISLICRVIFKY